MVKEVITKLIFQEALKTTAKFFKERKLKVDTTEVQVEEAIANHLTYIDNWSKEINFSDLKKTKLTAQVYVEVDISLIPRKRMFHQSERTEKMSSRKTLKDLIGHLVIVGQPGAGKTTLMKYWCQSIIWDADFYPDTIKVPLFIKLRDINDSHKTDEKNIIMNALLGLLGLKLIKEQEHDSLNDDEYTRAKETLLFSFLNRMKPLIILDGFDEVSSEKTRTNIINNFIKLTLNVNEGIVILTCRSSDYNYSVERARVLEICSLDEEQIKRFALKWLEDNHKADDFLLSLKSSPFYDTAIRPLTISHLCAIYERIGKIPDKPKTVYKKIINLLLDEWDEQRGVKRMSAYGNFETDRKFEFLCRIAFEISCDYKSSSFTERTLETVFKKICGDFSLDKKDAKTVVQEIESHTGLILQSGYETFEFAHKSLQEFLCAEHLVKLPSIPINLQHLSIFPNELAIAVTISSNPSLYFCELVFNRFLHRTFEYNTPFSHRFFSTFVNRLVLEKPDFNTSEDISFSLVILYTLFRRGDSNQLRLFENDLPLQFEKFVSLILERNTKFEYAKYYRIEESLHSENSEVVYKLRLLKNIKAKAQRPLPDYIFAKKSFIDESNN